MGSTRPVLGWHELKDLKEAKGLASQKVLTLVVHYRSSLEQALDLVRHGETSMPLADYFRVPMLAKQYAPVAKLSDFRYTKKYLSVADVEMLIASLPNIESLELVILSQAKFSQEQAQLFAKLFAEWSERMKSLKVWAKVAIEGIKDKASQDWNTLLDDALFGPIQTEFKALEHLTLDVWEFPIDNEFRKRVKGQPTLSHKSLQLFPMVSSDVRNVELENHWKTVKEFNFGSRNNCTSVWQSVLEFDAIEGKDLQALQMAVPFGRLFEPSRHDIKDEHDQVAQQNNIESVLVSLKAEQDNWLPKRCDMVGMVVSSQTQLNKVLDAFPVLTRLAVELADGATVNESDVVNLIAARKYKLVDLRIYYSTPTQLNKPFGSKPTAQLPDVVSLTLGTFSIGLFRFNGDSHKKAASGKKPDKLDLTLVKKVVPNCHGLVLRIESPYYECDFCHDRRQHFQRSLRQSQIELKKGLDAIRIDFINLDEPDVEVAGDESFVFTSLLPPKIKKRPVTDSAKTNEVPIKNETTGDSANPSVPSKPKTKTLTEKATKSPAATTGTQRSGKTGTKASPGGNKPKASPTASPKVTSQNASSKAPFKATSPRTQRATSPKGQKGSPGTNKQTKKTPPNK